MALPLLSPGIFVKNPGLRLGRPSYAPAIFISIAAIFLTASGICYAEKLQLLSVQEDSPGVVTARVATFGGGTPNASEIRLRFDEKIAIEAKEVKAVESAVLQTGIIVAVDLSGSMGGSHIREIREAVTRALSPPPPRVNVALWSFDTEVKKLHPFSSNATELTKSVSKIGFHSVPDGKTKLNDSIALALSDLRNYEVQGPKRLVLITDGTDDGSITTDQVVIKEANAKGVTIDAIGYGNVSSSGSELLARLAKNAGGHFVLAKGSAQLFGELQKLLSLPPPRAFDVLFRYEVSGDKRPINSAQLELAPLGRSAILLPVERGLSPPRTGMAPVPDPGGNYKVWLGAIMAVLALLAAYMLSKKKTASNSRTSEPLIISPKLPVTDVAEQAPAKRAKTRVSFAFPPPSKGQPAAYLVCVSGAGKGAEFAIEKAIIRIGSGKENELQVSDDYASRKHAVIQYESGGLYLSDSGSRNGTFLNETQLHGTAMVLSPGDRIRVGKTTFELSGGKNRPGPAEEEVNWGETKVP